MIDGTRGDLNFSVEERSDLAVGCLLHSSGTRVPDMVVDYGEGDADGEDGDSSEGEARIAESPKEANLRL